MRRFENKVAIVTGCGDGIGYGISERLSHEGANVMVVDFNAEIASQSVSELDSKNSGSVKLTVGDVSNPQTSIDAVKNTLDSWGKVDILVNNAGINMDNLSLRMKEEEWKKVIDINLSSTFLITKNVIKKMLKHKIIKWKNWIRITHRAI